VHVAVGGSLVDRTFGAHSSELAALWTEHCSPVPSSSVTQWMETEAPYTTSERLMADTHRPHAGINPLATSLAGDPDDGGWRDAVGLATDMNDSIRSGAPLFVPPAVARVSSFSTHVARPDLSTPLISADQGGRLKGGGGMLYSTPGGEHVQL
jgi:hypothetical protein